MSKFKIGDRVRTLKGCRFKGKFSGMVCGFGRWMRFPAVKVQKDDGHIVLCLEKNLMIEEARGRE